MRFNVVLVIMMVNAVMFNLYSYAYNVIYISVMKRKKNGFYTGSNSTKFIYV